MDNDISRKAVIVLVLIAVVISILSTSLVISTIYNTNPQNGQQVSNDVPSGKVVFTVPQQPPTGRVVFTVGNQS